MAKSVGKAKPTETNQAWPADEVARWPVARLVPYARNARTHSDAQVAVIAGLIREYGWTMPVLVDEQGGIIAGHGRVLAAHALGLADVPTIVARGWTPEQIKSYRIADNQSALLSGWNTELLGLELAELRGAGADLGSLGFEAAALQELLAGVGAVEGVTQMPPLPSGERNPFQVMTFILHDDQVELVKAALEAAKAEGAFIGPNKNSNGNALARICEAYDGQIRAAA